MPAVTPPMTTLFRRPTHPFVVGIIPVPYVLIVEPARDPLGFAFAVDGIADLLVVDFAPRQKTGTFIGLVLTGDLLCYYYVQPILVVAAHDHGLDSSAIVFVAAMIGTVSSLLLLRPSVGGTLQVSKFPGR